MNFSIVVTYLEMRKDGEVVLGYQKALIVLESAKGENHPSFVVVYVFLSNVYIKTRKLREAR